LWLVHHLQTQLEQADFIVDTATDGDQATYLIQEYDYDIILMNIFGLSANLMS
ncbi:MAG: hypothetical protein IE914_06690, partial [Thiotrichales bacterium]|nr:hypothetical protein [Thiotrichales bacterium]